MRSAIVAAMLCCCANAAVVLDRIVVTVDNRVIKDSDIAREIRVTSFINGDPLEFTAQARRKAAERLIDQSLIRNEEQVSQYREATSGEVEKLLEQIRAKRFPSAASLTEELKRYGITGEQLRKHLAWQLNVLNFIEQRFRPGVLVSDEEVKKYFQENRAKFRAADNKPVTLEDVRDGIVEQIAGERVNREFFDWLERARSGVNIRYREAALK